MGLCSESVSSYSTPIPLCLAAFLLIGGIDTVVGILIAPFCPAYIFVGGLKIEESLCLTYICSFKDHSKGWRNVQCEQVNMFVFLKMYIFIIAQVDFLEEN